ncbi:hypothetical protein PHYPO_G00047560 [Pangasianodon hypophthalmus]|uniref:Uncharacterized protein n=1 Tax=Pangasianodon hypophthalmus TaxID=310915 RepID=A0A5N5MGQ5_PANHP|nr:hypothetical protein PHYPO_G00047560 [Pangasianodon hypophthalmus]
MEANLCFDSKIAHFATRAQNKDVEIAAGVASPSKTNQKKKEDEVQYGELVFNAPAPKKSEMPKGQDECVYSQVQHGQ